MESTTLNFAGTLRHADRSDTDIQFPRFSSLPPELRTAIWHCALPDEHQDPPAIFSQRDCWRDDDGVVAEPAGWVPIRMTTTCAALLHVNREAQGIVLSWAASHEYKLGYRVACFDCPDDPRLLRNREMDDQGNWYPPDQLPVQGPIFIRQWDPSKDILHVSDISDGNQGPGWSENYMGGEQLRGVQHIAFTATCIGDYTRRRWLHRLLVAMPDLKSMSIDFSCPVEEDGDPMSHRLIKIASVGETCDNIWAHARWEPSEENVDEDGKDPYVWEDCEDLEHKLLQDYVSGDFWLPVDHDTGDSSNDGADADQKILKRPPPWIRDPVGGGLAFETQRFEMVERRGYDDVRGGLVVDLADLYPPRPGSPSTYSTDSELLEHIASLCWPKTRDDTVASD
ncbi:hypothetical protein LIA77_08201 [Sarocladium implicatum]|nr:hypothetical protein LIA77_08201 [Sarocladium implicatum]